MKFFSGKFLKNPRGTPCEIWPICYNSFCDLRMRLIFIANCSAGVAQLAEHDVANVVVEGSNPFARS